MGQSDKNTAGEGEEIDRIMKEIEDLEKKMDSAPETESQPSSLASADETTGDDETEEGGKVVAMRPAGTPAGAHVGAMDSLAETDAVPAPDEPLMKDNSSSSEGGLSMKIGGCTDVSLEFTRAGMTVSLSCSDECLVITTDQGAEFKIPFKRAA